MQSYAADRIDSRAVFLVTDDAMTQLFHVNTNLVLSSCFQVHFQQRVVFVALDGSIVRDCLASVVGILTRIDNQGFAFLQVRSDGAFRFFHRSFNDCDIGSFRYSRMPGILQYSFDVFSFSENHQSRGISVEAMHNEYFVCWVLFFDVSAQKAISGFRSFLLGRNRQHACMFVDDDEIVVLKDNADAAVLFFFRDLAPSHLDFLLGRQRVVVLSDRLTIDSNLFVSQEVLDVVPALVRKF